MDAAVGGDGQPPMGGHVAILAMAATHIEEFVALACKFALDIR